MLSLLKLGLVTSERHKAWTEHQQPQLEVLPALVLAQGILHAHLHVHVVTGTQDSSPLFTVQMRAATKDTNIKLEMHGDTTMAHRPQKSHQKLSPKETTHD